MPGWLRWPRRNKGFEWHTYVRTTVKLRREERKQKLEEIREMAAEGARQAGRQGMAAGRQGVAAGRHRIRVSGYRLGRWAGKAAGAARAMLAGIGRSAGSGFSAAARRIKGLGLQGGTWQGRGRVPVSLMPALSTRAKISVLFGLLAGLAGASSLMQVQDFGEGEGG